MCIHKFKYFSQLYKNNVNLAQQPNKFHHLSGISTCTCIEFFIILLVPNVHQLNGNKYHILRNVISYLRTKFHVKKKPPVLHVM